MESHWIESNETKYRNIHIFVFIAPYTSAQLNVNRLLRKRLKKENHDDGGHEKIIVYLRSGIFNFLVFFCVHFREKK